MNEQQDEEDIYDAVRDYRKNHPEQEPMIIKCGDKVRTIIGGVDAMVTCISNRSGEVNYELTYLHGGEFKTTWMKETEFNKAETKSQIGYTQAHIAR